MNMNASVNAVRAFIVSFELCTSHPNDWRFRMQRLAESEERGRGEQLAQSMHTQRITCGKLPLLP